MEPSPDRRNDRSERVPLRLAVELGDGDFRDPFAADALNFSKGGISVRAACLPDLHSRLWCRFECLPSRATLTAQGEVVWAHLDGDCSGEFGLAFVDLDPKTEWLLEEMIAEHAALARGHGEQPCEPVARLATLELEGSPAPIEAHLARREEGGAVFEQQLDLLSLGRGVLARAPGSAERTGRIAGVELRMVGSVPMLAVTVAFEQRESYGELSWSGSDPAPDHDTEPDLAAPPSRAGGPQPHAAGAQTTVTEFALEPREAHAEHSPAAPADNAPLPPALQASPSREPAARASAAQPAKAAAAAAVASERDFSRSFALPGDDADDQLEDELEAFSAPAWQPLLRAALRGLRAQLAILGVALARLCAAAFRRALPAVRGTQLRTTSTLRALYGNAIGPRVGTARRMLRAQLPGKRRRTTRAPIAARRAGSGSLGRTLLLGLLAALGAGLGVYALGPFGHAERIDLPRGVRPDASPAAVAAPATPAAAAAPVAPAPSASAAAGEPHAAVAEVAVASAERVPPSSPYAIDVRKAGAASGEPAHKLRFGASTVPNARHFTLRMSGRVRTLQGTPDRGGFTVVIPGCLSLDRAGPIGSALKSVAHARIINKGDHAELSVRFTDGKQPAYRVSADGSTLNVAIEE